AAGADILGTIPELRHLPPACRYHHERWDGGGYPEGLSGEGIPLVAQILSICDAYDAITSERVYRPARSHREALEDIVLGAGAQFAPALVEEFVRLPELTFEGVRWCPAPCRPLGSLKRTARSRRRPCVTSRARTA
ncbi:MAG TPA: hypothetical protein EYQ64_10345, partial [Gemmatimonadetes bacterium]|nr:hypothetical protein [Gemmatimonadota bacterium]